MFFFFKQKTAYEMRISDWSSDVCSSDLLPPLHYHQHVVGVEYAPSIETGLLFPMQAATLAERIGARRETVEDRVRMAVEVTPSDRPFVWWCNLNAEAEALAKGIPGAVNLHGGLKDTDKERIIMEFLDGSIRVLVSKPSLCGFGMTFQHCADTGFVGQIGRESCRERVGAYV